jgi:hypothetical protein
MRTFCAKLTFNCPELYDQCEHLEQRHTRICPLNPCNDLNKQGRELCSATHICECVSSLSLWIHRHLVTAGPHQCSSVKAPRESRLQRSASSSIRAASAVWCRRGSSRTAGAACVRPRVATRKGKVFRTAAARQGGCLAVTRVFARGTVLSRPLCYRQVMTPPPLQRTRSASLCQHDLGS